jgi:arylsulfatase A-like enzyme
MHGFDEFFGNLYHLNAEEEPEQRTYPGPKFKEMFGPRGVIRSRATDKDKFLATFKEFPPRQRAASFSIDQAVDKMKQNLGGN